MSGPIFETVLSPIIVKGDNRRCSCSRRVNVVHCEVCNGPAVTREGARLEIPNVSLAHILVFRPAANAVGNCTLVETAWQERLKSF